MQTLIIHAETKKLKAIAAFLKAFGVSFEIKKTEEEPYDPAFVEKILKARSEKGGKTIDPYNLWETLKSS